MAGTTSNIVSAVSYTHIRFIQERSDDEGAMKCTQLSVPVWLHSRWQEIVKRRRKYYQYSVTDALKSANISGRKFLKCWRFVRPRTKPDKVLSLFKDAGFGQGPMGACRRTSLRVAFVRKILQRYKDMKVLCADMLLLFLFCFVVTICFLCLCTLMRKYKYCYTMCSSARNLKASALLLFTTCTCQYTCL